MDRQPPMPELPPAVAQALTRFLLEQRRLAPGLVSRAIVTGSASTGDWHDGVSDIDVVFVVNRDPSPELEALGRLHAESDPHIDGVYLTESELARGPDAVLTAPQVVDGVLVSAMPGGQLSWATWRELESGVQGIVDGGDVIWSPTSDRHPDSQTGVREYSRANLLDYWRQIGDGAEAELAPRSDDDPVRNETVRWIALGPIRLVASMETGEVVSKSEAAAVAAARWPEHAELLDRAARDRAGDRQTFTTGDARQAIRLLRECVALAEQS
ncbi:nucleotidyltransferase domain-containing protein [Leifsonia sp. F6_8S_P_1B]|uniref:Nucleotidyltransferase domain-containing protein n=1 Tax=Leifsonia williamsii TaxID=3035919 RepID=A0ABT8KBW3_9MICO|nr:nucleotidyltransferase domain-containing protein [Leifsonia williamsii]MDN4614497.1 nucleotidyltransferase domain-containing protein [Leifsonia williamsii]